MYLGILHESYWHWKVQNSFLFCSVPCRIAYRSLFWSQSQQELLLRSGLGRMEQNQIQADPFPLPHLKALHLLLMMGTKLSVWIFYLFLPKVWSIICFKNNRIHLTKYCNPLFSGWICNHSWLNWILLLSSCVSSFNSSASSLV